MGEISVAVRVVYNGGCDSSRDEFERLSAAIIDAFRSTEVTSDIPENIQNVRAELEPFEVFVNNVLVYSKRYARQYPDCEEIVQVVQEVYNRVWPPRRIDGGPRIICNVL
ncbi:uncharacterized protein [Dysidea avara]|uniref:uncharacterized protein n=1 Tax=Dysidea avara TaxID=196820 RepID=UPI0033183D68